jgi:chitinase
LESLILANVAEGKRLRVFNTLHSFCSTNRTDSITIESLRERAVRLNLLKVRFGAALLVCLLAVASICAAQEIRPMAPPQADIGFLAAQGAQPRFESANKMSSEAELALRQQRALSVPHFTNSFPFEGKTFPFSVVGAKPQAGGTTKIATQLKPIDLLFSGYADEDGQPLVLSASAVIDRVVNSPNFRQATYQTGFTQFADAVQRAQFYSAMSRDWHTLLDAPQVLKPLTIVVPKTSAKVFRNRSTGQVYAVVDMEFFISQLNTLVQMENLDASALPVILTRNVLLAPEANVQKCCVLGFHTAFDGGVRDSVQTVQTLVWASWIDQGTLGAGIADITAMSHEISEWMNDPFGTNIVPAWQYPTPNLGCQSTLETGDPLAALPNAGFPVSIDDMTYHPQNQVLLPWFTRQPSTAVDGAYTFPDQSLLTSPAQACPTK